MNYNTISISKENEVMVITINRESKLNALNIETLREIKDAVLSVYADNSIKGIIITGAGQKAFAAGADIAEFANFSVEEGTKMSADGHSTLNTIEASPKPVIAAVNGFALGGGCELAMACHLRVASENAKFGQPEVNLGLIPGYAGTQRLVQLVGKGKALEILMTGDPIKAQEALELGLVNHVVPMENLMGKCMEILDKIKTKSPVAIKGVIQCVNEYFAKDGDGFNMEIKEFGNSFGTGDFKEGTTAFLEKRKANFQGN